MRLARTATPPESELLTQPLPFSPETRPWRRVNPSSGRRPLRYCPLVPRRRPLISRADCRRRGCCGDRGFTTRLSSAPAGTAHCCPSDKTPMPRSPGATVTGVTAAARDRRCVGEELPVPGVHRAILRGISGLPAPHTFTLTAPRACCFAARGRRRSATGCCC